MTGPEPRPRSEIRPLAILAPTYRIAQVEAEERHLGPREWFYVMSERSILGVEHGEYAIRIPVGHELTRDQQEARDRMDARGWRLRGYST